MPPGHLNAVFLENISPLDVPDWRQAVRAARQQGAFVFWNHPGWRGQQRDGVVRWYPEHTELVEQGALQGIEVVNGRDYYAEAHRISLEKNLAPLANSDVHLPLDLDYHVHEGDHRPVTLVFARDRSREGIREALFARRTAAWSADLLVGREELLRALLDAALQVENRRLQVRAGDHAYVRLRNDSDLRFELAGADEAAGLRVPARLVVAPRGTSLLEVRAPLGTAPGPRALELAYTIGNLRPAPDRALAFSLTLDVEVQPPAR
jgi:hypothetical protein